MTLGQVWILWEPAIGWAKPRLCNYKYTQLHIRNIAKYYQRFFASTLENGLIFEYFELCITGWYCELWPGDEKGNEPSSAETITSLPHPALSFVVFQNREQEDLSSSLPQLPGHHLSCDRMLCDLHVAGFHVAHIRLLFWWHSHWLTFVHSYPSQSKQFAILENQDPETEGRGRQGQAQAPRALPFSCPHRAWYPWVAACLSGKKWRWSPVRLWHLLGSAHFLLEPVFVSSRGSCGPQPGLAPVPHMQTSWARLWSLARLIPHLTHHYPSKPSPISHFHSDILDLSWLKCYHLHAVPVSFSPYATNGHNLSQKVKSDTSTEGQNMLLDIVS